MLSDQAEEAARLLCAARHGPPVHELPQSCRPKADADAYPVQGAVVRQLGETIGGWKVGAGSAASAAFCGPIWKKMVRPSPASYVARELRLIGIEAEVAFRLGRDLPARAAAYDRHEVTAGAVLHPAIELVDSRYGDFRSLDRISILADNFSNGGLVYGAAVPDLEKLDLGQTTITVTEDGQAFADRRAGADRDPLAELWALGHLLSGTG